VRREPSWRSLGPGIIYAVLAVGFGFAALVVGVVTYQLNVHGVETSATVVETGVGMKHHGVTVEFRTGDGVSVRARVLRYEVAGPDVGDTVRIRYSAGDPSLITGAGRFALVMNILMTLGFGYAAIALAVRAYRRTRHRPPPRPAPQAPRIGQDADPTPAQDPESTRGPVPEAASRRSGKALAALAVAGVALVTYRGLSRRRPR
jgi:hypothetical protein